MNVNLSGPEAEPWGTPQLIEPFRFQVEFMISAEIIKDD